MLSSVYGEPGLSMNIFGMGGKLPVQKGFFQKSWGWFIAHPKVSGWAV